MDNYGTYVTAVTGLHSRRSTPTPVMRNQLNIQVTEIDALTGHYVPLLSEHNPVIHWSGQEEDLMATPRAMKQSEDVPSRQEDDRHLHSSIPPNNCSDAKHGEKTKQNAGIGAIRNRSYGSGQYFRLAHEYAESAHTAAQMELSLMSTSFEYDISNYSTHPAHDYWMTMVDEQDHYMRAQVHNHLFGTPEVEIGDELGWSSRAWNVYSYAEPGGKVERFYSAE